MRYFAELFLGCSGACGAMVSKSEAKSHSTVRLNGFTGSPFPRNRSGSIEVSAGRSRAQREGQAGGGDCSESGLGTTFSRLCIAVNPSRHRLTSLRCTLEGDHSIQSGLFNDFISLEPRILKAVATADRRHATTTYSATAVGLRSVSSFQQVVITEELFAEDQLMLSAEIKPRRFRTRWQSTVCDEPAGTVRGGNGWAYCPID